MDIISFLYLKLFLEDNGNFSSLGSAIWELLLTKTQIGYLPDLLS